MDGLRRCHRRAVKVNIPQLIVTVFDPRLFSLSELIQSYSISLLSGLEQPVEQRGRHDPDPVIVILVRTHQETPIQRPCL